MGYIEIYTPFLTFTEGHSEDFRAIGDNWYYQKMKGFKMSRFYVSGTNLRGNEFTSTIRENSTVHVRGWNMGVKIYLSEDENGNDKICIYSTRGTNNPESILIATLKNIDGDIIRTE